MRCALFFHVGSSIVLYILYLLHSNLIAGAAAPQLPGQILHKILTFKPKLMIGTRMRGANIYANRCKSDWDKTEKLILLRIENN